MTLDDAVIARHTVKAFEPGKTLPQEKIDTLLNVLQNSPSSVNSQPWHFVVASTPEGRETIAKSTSGAYAYNEPKVLNASHVIALCMRSDLDDQHLQNVLAQEQKMAALSPKARRPAGQESPLLCGYAPLRAARYSTMDGETGLRRWAACC